MRKTTTLTQAMVGRPNTLVCSFDPTSPRITAWDIHEWIHDALKIPEQDVQLVQIDGIRRQVFIKLRTSDQILTIIKDTNGRVDYKYPSGEVYPVTIDLAGLGTKRIRIANLPPEIPDEILRDALKPYGKVLDISIESWSKAYRYQVSNGIRIIQIVMSKHAPSNLTVAGNRVILSYEGQPLTCYGCGNEGHIFSACPTRKGPVEARKLPRPASYATVLARSDPDEEINMTDHIHTKTQKTLKTHTTDMRDGPHPSTSRDGPSEIENTVPQRKEPVTPPNAAFQPADPPPPEKETNTESAEHDLMETETLQAAPPETQDGAQQKQDIPKEQKREIPQTKTIDTEKDGDEGDKDLTVDAQPMEEEATFKPEKETSPKRNKKMKMDRQATQVHDRSRSATRRSLYKGKSQ